MTRRPIRPPAAESAAGHQHAEAFALMIYRDAQGREERIWNSRDGVTPFIVRSRTGDEMTHVDWGRDVYAPDHVPGVGDRIFVDLTEERAAERARAFVAHWWNDPMYPLSAHPAFGAGSEAEAIAAVAVSIYGDGRGADLIEVTRDVWARFAGAGRGRPTPPAEPPCC